MRVSSTSTLVAAASLFLPSTLAVFADDAWNLDWQYTLVGSPQEHTTFFHQPVAASPASLLYTVSERSVVGAVNPKDGTLRWRQQLAHTNSTFLRSGQDQDVVITAVDGQVAAWGAADGRQAWSVDLKGFPVKDLEILEIPEVDNQGGSKDAIVLTGGPHATVHRLDQADGHSKWSWTDETGDEALQVSASSTHVFYISLHSSMLGGLKIKVASLDPVTGRKLDQHTLSSESDLSSASDILTVGANTASPIIAWTDKARSVLRVNIIGTKEVSSFNIEAHQDVKTVRLHAPYHINARPHFLVHYETDTHHWAEVYHVDLTKSAITKAFSLPKLAGRGAFSASTSHANVYFTRISESDVSVVSSASHGILARWPLKAANGVVFNGYHAPVHTVSEVSVKSDKVSAARTAVYLASGEWVLIQNGVAVWERPEMLASTKSAVWAYPSISEGLVHELELEGHSNPLQAYVHRVGRHIHDLKALPAHLAALPGRIASSVFGTTGLDTSTAVQDVFGYHKKVVCATDNGRLVALDAGDQGRQVWNVNIPTMSSPRLAARADGTISVISEDGSQHKLFNASSGQEVAYTEPTPLSETLQRPTVIYNIQNGRLVGGPEGSSESWRFAPTNGESIYSLTPRPLDDPVASIGKVLGDRKVLYKYLNPNVLLVISVSEEAGTATISVLDAISGSAIYTASHQGVDMSVPIASAMSENWFVYTFASRSKSAGVTGYQLVVGELFESPFPNDRGPHGSAMNVSEVDYSYQPYVVSQSYRIREPISKLAVTQSRQGISSRALLAVLPESNAIVAIPRQIVDSRRPVNRDPTKDELMEGLLKYTPVLDFDPKWYLSHQREVLGVDALTTSPTLLESTSLVFAYGLDVFGTRISPSFSFDVLGKDFNKLQMLATVAALAVATVAVAPLVRRKQINTRWQFL